MNNTEKRKAGEYEILNSLYIGDKEIVLGENLLASKDQKYLCAYCERHDVIALYDNCLVSDDYSEIVKLFGERIAQQAEKTLMEIKLESQGIDNTPLNENDCIPIKHTDNINNKIILINKDCLRREYQVATHQIKLCVGGFGASPNSRGSACFCVDLYSGQHSRFERRDVLGILKKEQLPGWAKTGLEKYSRKKEMQR